MRSPAIRALQPSRPRRASGGPRRGRRFGRGAWLWRAESTARDELRVAFFPRESLAQPEEHQESGELGPDEAQVLDLLERCGASFVADLARVSGIEPSRVRRALVNLTGR